MPKICQLLGKGTSSGNNKPFSLKRTKRTFKANLQKKRIFDPITRSFKTVLLSTKAIKSMKKWEKEMFGDLPISEKTTTDKKSKTGEGKHVHKQKLTPKQKKELEAQEKEKMKKTTEEAMKEKKIKKEGS